MILVTGSNGKVGQQLVQALQRADVPFRALARNHASAKTLADRGIDVVRGDLTDRATLAPALRGVKRLFLLSSGPDPFAAEVAAIDAATEAGVEHVVKLSAFGADVSSTNSFLRGHGRAEAHLETAGPAWTMLRPSFFMQNWVLYNGAGIRAGQPVYANTGTARLGWIDTRDIADVAAAALTQDGHRGRVYDLTGPEALSYADVTAMLGQVLAKKVSYVPVSDAAAMQAILATGMPAEYAYALVTLNQLVRRGSADATTQTVELVTGNPARTMRAFLDEHRAEFTVQALQ